MPGYWTRWTKITANMSFEERERAMLNNSLIIDKRPFFMKHLYPRLNKKYIWHNSNYDNHTITTFGKSLEDLIYDYHHFPNRLTSAEYEVIDRYYRFSPVIETDCISNKVCRFLESEVKEIRNKIKNNNLEDIIKILMDNTTELDDGHYQSMKDLHKQYKSGKSNFAFIKDSNGKGIFSNLEQYNKYILEEAYRISSDVSELVNLAVRICYIDYPHDAKQFVWHVFGKDIIKNINRNRQKDICAPFLSASGDIEYLGSYFQLQAINTEIERYQEEVSYDSYL
jgi:hypothetical protein